MNAGTQIPMPPRRWAIRIGLPMLILAATAALLLSTMWSSIMPARAVRTVPALVRDVDAPINEPAAVATTDAIVQAPGWVEPDPYGVYAGALAEGVVREVLVLEGDAVRCAVLQHLVLLVGHGHLALVHSRLHLGHLQQRRELLLRVVRDADLLAAMVCVRRQRGDRALLHSRRG